jgi:hypothetical protein
MWEKGQSGNPAGRAVETEKKPFLSALNRALVQEDYKRLRQAAEKLLDLAADGVPWAIGFLKNMVDGKAPIHVKQDVTHTVITVSDTDSLIGEVVSRGEDRALAQPVSH